ncbi:MAG TPA: hypothetical protein IAC02_08050 [Candidatus Coprovivens excrementavium]|nr:hypothetical protein [Candidatus Coprovivens excrementavium]
MVELDVKKIVRNKPKVKRLELEYQGDNYIIINLEANVIDVNGKLWEYKIDVDNLKDINNLIWDFEELDEFDYWPDKTRDHAPLSPMWRLSWYDEYDTYYHKSGALKYPDNFMKLVDTLKKLK